ncbi:MAG: S8 family serine peptidase [Candidatus Kapaibacteriota bacterium]|jgi:hypothetical protein
MIFIFILLAINLFQTNLYSEKYRIFFKDKGTRNFYKGSALFELTKSALSIKSIHRRIKVFPSDSFVTYADAPIPEPFLNSITETGAKILLKLKWLNYVVVEANENQINQISKLEFVKFVQTIGEKPPKELTNNILFNELSSVASRSLLTIQNNDNPYGESLNQWQMLSIDKLHSLGILGDSVLFGIIDTGFRWKTNKIFQQTNVLAEYDFLFQDSKTENEEADTTVQDHHGTMVFSIVSGFKEGFLVGGAPLCTFVLAKTEDYRKESHFEEDCFAAAIEWMDSIGVDIISSSLGYSNFDSPESSYSFEDFDGKTTLVSAYANRAKKLGITIISSAGNRGPNDSTIQAPAEALGEIAIGAVNPTADSVLKFSSRGPTFDGRIKPDFVAQGTNVAFAPASINDTVMFGSGTSVAGPIFASGVALLLSGFEELTPDMISTLLKQHSSRKGNPDNSWGYGLVDFYQAALDYDIVISNPITYYNNGTQRILFKIKYSKEIEFAKLYYRKANEVEHLSVNLTKIPWTDDFYFDLHPSSNDTLLYVYVIARSVDGKERRKPFYESKEFEIQIGKNSKNIFLFKESLLNIAFKENANEIRIFPTVLDHSNELYLEINDFQEDAIDVEILNLYGTSLEKTTIIAPKHTLHKIKLKNLSNGLYFVKLSTPSRILFIGKLIKVF